MRRPWDAAFERECDRAIRGAVDAAATEAQRQDAWRSLMLLVAPAIEEWAERSHVLHHWRLSGPDEARAVLVSTLGRLAADRYANLRRYRDRRAHTEDGADAQLDVVERLARLGDDGEEPTVSGDDGQGTPFRAWLLTLVRFVVADHVRTRMGWTSQAGPDKRDLGSNAQRLSDAPEPAQRPAITDWLTARQQLADVDAAVATFPEPMRTALDLWKGDASYAEIAQRLGLGRADAAEKLVRAAKARLREKLREPANLGA